MITSKTQAINKITRYFNNKTPFLFIIDFLQKKNIVLSEAELKDKQILFSIPNKVMDETFAIRNFHFDKKPIDKQSYKESFEKVMRNIYYGNSYLVNLSIKVLLDTNLSLSEIYKLSRAKYKLCFLDEFVVSSPESFVKIENDKIFTYPMKGTIDADIPNAKNIILDDKKEKAEHSTIVDLLRNDLSMVANKVKVNKFRYVDELRTTNKNLLQISSEIEGLLCDNYKNNIGELIYKLLPAGSITGAPKKKTVEIIKEAEQNERGYYTGVFGYYDGEVLDSAVMIRFIEKQNGKLYYRAGGGITHLSKLDAEYKECFDKVYLQK